MAWYWWMLIVSAGATAGFILGGISANIKIHNYIINKFNGWE